MCVCVYACVCITHMCRFMCIKGACVHRGQKWVSGFISQEPVTLVFETKSLAGTQGSLIRLGWFTSESEQSACLAISIVWIVNMCHYIQFYYVHSGITLQSSWSSGYRLSFLLRSPLHMDTSLRTMTHPTARHLGPYQTILIVIVWWGKRIVLLTSRGS